MSCASSRCAPSPTAKVIRACRRRRSLAALSDKNPRVRLIAAWGLGRLGRAAVADSIVPLTIDTDPLVAHVAVNALVEMKAADACLAAIDNADAKLTAGAASAANVLQQMHEPAVVGGMIARLERVKNPAVRTQVYRALTRLHSREKEWDGEWWQTRPDTTGPYFQPVGWSETARIADVIRRALSSESPQTVRALLIDCGANRVDLPEVNERLLAVDPGDAALCRALLDTLVRQKHLSERQIAAARTIMDAETASPAIRAKTIQVLSWEWAGDAAIEAVVDALGGVARAARIAARGARRRAGIVHSEPAARAAYRAAGAAGRQWSARPARNRAGRADQHRAEQADRAGAARRRGIRDCERTTGSRRRRAAASRNRADEGHAARR